METSGFLRQGGSVRAESLITASSNICDFSSVDDDGRVVAVDAEVAEYSTLLGYWGTELGPPVRPHTNFELEQGDRCRYGKNAEPAMQFGEPAVVETGVKMSIEITRIVLIPDENEILRGEELAVAGNQDSAVGPR